MSGFALPSSIARDAYAELRREPARWLPAMSSIASAHAPERADLRAVETGSNLIALLGDDLVIKLFPPFLAYQFESERRALRVLNGRLRTPTPAIVAESAIDDWPYLVITRLEGVALGAIWSEIAEEERRSILHAIGALIAEVQALPLGVMTELEPRWSEFIEQQARHCRERHQRLGLATHLLADIERYLAKTASVLPERSTPVILTGEYTPDNVMVVKRDGAWRISGLIDFGDARVGFGEYDLLGPGTFLAAGNPERLQRLLDGYGYGREQRTPDLSRRLMRMLLLHRHSDLGGQIALAGWRERARDLDELERLLWPLGGSR
jgi:hygromycin-B 7''-O-kinase